MKSAYRLGCALGGLLTASVLLITEPECSNLTPTDLERFANGETVEYATCNPHRAPVIGLVLAALGFGAWWYFDPAQSQVQPTSTPQPFDESAPGTSLRQAVADAIRTHPDYHWLLKLLECNTVLIVGPQGSGKTRFAVALAYLRMIICHHAIRDVNAHGQQQTGWPGQPAEGSQDIEAIADRVADYLESLKTKKQPSKPLTEILDEFTLQNKGAEQGLNQRSDKGVARADGFFTSITTESGKAGEHHILVAHDQSQSLAMGAHKQAGVPPLKYDYIVLSLHAARTSTGIPVTSHRATVIGVDFDQDGQPSEAAVSYPEWFNPEILGEVLFALPASFHLEARRSAQKADRSDVDRRDPNAPKKLPFSEDFGDLEKSWELAAMSELTSVFSAKPPEKPITPLEAIDLLLSNKTPKNLIIEYWGVTGGRAYREVSDLLKNAISEYASLEQWRQLKATHSKFFGA